MNSTIHNPELYFLSFFTLLAIEYNRIPLQAEFHALYFSCKNSFSSVRAWRILLNLPSFVRMLLDLL